MIKLGLLWYSVYNLGVSTEKMGMGQHRDEANVSVSYRQHYHVTYRSQLASYLFEIGKLVLSLGEERPGMENSNDKMSATKAKLF